MSTLRVGRVMDPERPLYHMRRNMRPGRGVAS
jgi:hypothetical protein